jgi:hypothetical protein|tara:strand:+ start:4235 stop:4822 length:588 start_codon:yes stop_codon:yes gene_type:complete
MKINLIRTQFGNDATNGLLFIDEVFECFTLEDQYQDKKVFGETCIPEGTYPVEFRKEGGFHNRYSTKYDFHKGMLEIKDIPNFKWVLFHLGNTDENTAGCVLVGDTQQDLDVSKDGFIGSSGNAYKKFYPKVATALENGESVSLIVSKVNLSNLTKITNSSGPEYVNAQMIDEKISEIKGELKILSAKMDGINFQ